MLSDVQNDMLGLSFNVEDYDFFNFMVDISSIDLSFLGGAFGASGRTPTFEFTLYDNPSSVNGVGSGAILDRAVVSGTTSSANTFDWTNVQVPLETLGNTNGNVTLRIDLLDGAYSAIDNIRIVASDTAGDMKIPEPSSVFILLIGLVGVFVSRNPNAIQALKLNAPPLSSY